MKKLLTLCGTLLIGASALWGQASWDRILVKTTTGMTQGYLAERVEEISFATVEGSVRADVKITGIEETNSPRVFLSVHKTAACRAYKLAVLQPGEILNLKTDDLLAEYVDRTGTQFYFDDFDEAEISGFDGPFTPDADYMVATVGYDEYSIPCGVSRGTFHTTPADIVGNPQVEGTVQSVAQTSFTVAFKPNTDVGRYYICSFDKTHDGDFQAQYEMWGGMFGFNSPSDMIKMFSGNGYTGQYTNTWRDMTPGTDYEVWIAIEDTKGNFAQPVCVPLTTTKFGDEGEAEVSISIGQFKLAGYDDKGNAIYTQTVTFAPNKSTMMYRDMLIEKDYLEAFEVEEIPGKKGEEAVIEYLKTPQVGNPYWDLYETDTWDWQLNPGTAYIAYAIGQNAKEEWGKVAKKSFSTPSGKPAARAGILPERLMPNEGTSYGTGIGNILKIKNINQNEINLHNINNQAR